MLNGFLYFLKRFWPFVLIGAMITLFVLFATRQSNLDVYTGGQSTYTVETETETEKKVITNTYMNSEIKRYTYGLFNLSDSVTYCSLYGHKNNDNPYMALSILNFSCRFPFILSA